MKSSRRQIHSSLDLPAEGTFLLAFSGGMDSLALLMLLDEEQRARTTALYVDHGIRERSELDKEIELNKKNTRRLGVPLFVVRLGEGEVFLRANLDDCGIEAAARKLRYDCLERFRMEHNIDYILTAHHRDDQTETLMMRLNSPIWAWGGIRRKEGHILRPMLSVGKEDIRRLVTSSSFRWSEDSTNSDENYRRNWIRKHVLPLLGEREKELLSSIAANVSSFPHTPVSMTRYGSLRVEVDRPSFLSAYPWDREKAVFSALSVVGNKTRVRRSFISEIEKGAAKGSGKTMLGQITVRYLASSVNFFSALPSFFSPYQGEETVLPLSLSLKYAPQNPLALEIPDGALCSAAFRKSREGDEIELKDGVRKVSFLLKEHHIPYAIVLEKGGVIIALFSAFLGGRDRINARLLGKKGRKMEIIP